MRACLKSVVAAAAAAMLLSWAASGADAQGPVVVTTLRPAVPSVVGYVPVRRGLFGRRIVYRPVVAPVVAAPVAVAQRPVVPAPVTTYYAPAPVTTYYAPAPSITVYRAPLPAYVPAYVPALPY